MAAIMAGSQLASLPLPNLSSSWTSTTTSSLGLRVQGHNTSGELKALFRVRSAARSPHVVHPARQCFHSGCTGLSAISNSRSFTFSPQVARYLDARPHKEQDNAVGLVVKAIFDFFKFIWNVLLKGPGLLFAKRLEGKIDEATDVVEDAAKVVISLARAGKKLADTVEDGLEEVEKYANMVVHATDVIDDKVEQAVDLLESAGEFAQAQAAKEAGPVVASSALMEKAVEVRDKSEELAKATSELKAVTTQILESPDSTPASVTSKSTTTKSS